MALEAVEAIKRAEADAVRIRAQAREEAQARIHAAEEQVREQLRTADIRQQAEYAAGLEQAGKDAAQQAAQNSTAAEAEAAALRDKLAECKPQAVERVIQAILE